MELTALNVLVVATWTLLAGLWWGATWADAKLALAQSDEEVGR